MWGFDSLRDCHFLMRDDLLKMAEGKSLLSKDTEREGLVFRPHGDFPHRGSFKAIPNKFLLKGGD